MAETAATFNAVFTESNGMTVSFAEDSLNAVVSFGEFTAIERDPYEGPYEVTPTQYTQILPSENKAMAHDITVNPIPNNYGLITWNGSTLTVS